MADLIFRTEDLRVEEIAGLFVEGPLDRRVVDALKGRQPIVLVGSRGVGKSFLLKVALAELAQEYEREQILPVYLSFIKSTLIASADEGQIRAWMLSKISSSILRAAARAGLIAKVSSAVQVLAGGGATQDLKPTRLEKFAESIENFWVSGQPVEDSASVPQLEHFLEAIDELCEECGIKRVSLLIDEAAHVFLPQQQRIFFTLFRDLRRPNITCNAAVYPGVTFYGPAFQPAHDAIFMNLDRDVWAADYVDSMKAMVERQADPALMKTLRTRGENFTILAYSAAGNPRSLLKTITSCPSLSSSEVNAVLRDFYRTQIWSEHSQLADAYPGYRSLIDWGRSFVEGHVLKLLKSRNDEALAQGGETALSIWVHRDAPEAVQQSLRILQYTAILKEHAKGIKATRSEIGTRYVVNLGCVLGGESIPTQTALKLVHSSSARRMLEFGARHESFTGLDEASLVQGESVVNSALNARLSMGVNVLDLTAWQKAKLMELGLHSVRDVLLAPEAVLLKGYYVGPVRAQQMRRAALTAVLEYLSG